MIERAVREVFEQAGIEVNGKNPHDIQVHDDRFYARVWRESSLGLGESYMDGWWDCVRVDDMIHRLVLANAPEQVRGNWGHLLRQLPGYLFNLQSMARSRIIADRHYDLGNDLFFAFLDPEHLQYSCGFFEDTDDLSQAQENKLALICGKLDLRPGDHLLDIGCGWGGLSRYAAERFGCTVTAVNISREQLRHARAWCEGLPVHFLDRDYREITGEYDKIVSVGMFEHVGSDNYDAFMRTAHRCLKRDGVFLLHTIGSNTTARKGGDPWVSKYIFPNGMLPSIAQIARAIRGRFVMEDWHNFGPHYDTTLMAWNANFQRAWPRLEVRYDARFKRMWEYYLLSFAGAFRARNIQLWQVVMTKAGSGTAQPPCRRPFEAMMST
jgi:cyclopropane-fatty-acyl-phospholipid synthase